MANDPSDWTELNSQDLQKAFDQARGFGELPYSQEAPATKSDAEDPTRWAEKLQFATLGAVGEIGELANILKKWRRQCALQQGAPLDIQEISAELGDVYAYILKFANVLGRDLEQVHLERMARNTIRFESAGRHDRVVVSIAGPSCSGKTTAVMALRENFLSGRAASYIENAANNRYLQALFDGEPFDCDQSQRWFINAYLEFLNALDAADPPKILLDQDPAAVPLAYSYVFFREGNLGSAEYTNHIRRYFALVKQLEIRAGRRAVILLDAEPAELRRRSLGRNAKTTAPLPWYEALRDRFLHIYDGLSNVIYIDTNSLTIEQMVDRVRKEMTRIW